MGLLDGVGSALSGIWNATLGRIFSPPAPPAPTEPAPRMAQDTVKLAHAGNWERIGSAQLPELKAPTPKLADPASIAPLRSAANTYFYKQGSDGSTRRPTEVTLLKNAYPASELDVLDLANDTQKNQIAFANTVIKPFEDMAIAKLSPDQQAAYTRLASQLEMRPKARMALQFLLLEGTLTSPPLSKDGKDLLSTLEALSKQPVVPGVDHNKLLSELVYELGVPSAINQSARGTCSVTTLQIYTAMEQPAEYARIISELAAPSGKTVLRSGETLERDADLSQPDGTTRSLPSRLWQPAMMEAASWSTLYEDGNGGHRIAGLPLGDGVSPGALHKMMKAVTGQNAIGYYTPSLEGFGGVATDMLFNPTSPDAAMSPMSHADLIARIQESTQAGSPVPVAMTWGFTDAQGKQHAGHEVLVTKIEGNTVYTTNPWGVEESMPLEFLQKNIRAASFAELNQTERTRLHQERLIPGITPQDIAGTLQKGLI